MTPREAEIYKAMYNEHYKAAQRRQLESPTEAAKKRARQDRSKIACQGHIRFTDLFDRIGAKLMEIFANWLETSHRLILGNDNSRKSLRGAVPFWRGNSVISSFMVDVQFVTNGRLFVLEADADCHSTYSSEEEDRRVDCISQAAVRNYGKARLTMIRVNTDRAIPKLGQNDDIDYSIRFEMMQRAFGIAIKQDAPQNTYDVFKICYDASLDVVQETFKQKMFVDMTSFYERMDAPLPKMSIIQARAIAKREEEERQLGGKTTATPIPEEPRKALLADKTYACDCPLVTKNHINSQDGEALNDRRIKRLDKRAARGIKDEIFDLSSRAFINQLSDALFAFTGRHLRREDCKRGIAGSMICTDLFAKIAPVAVDILLQYDNIDIVIEADQQSHASYKRHREYSRMDAISQALQRNYGAVPVLWLRVNSDMITRSVDNVDDLDCQIRTHKVIDFIAEHRARPPPLNVFKVIKIGYTGLRYIEREDHPLASYVDLKPYHQWLAESEKIFGKNPTRMRRDVLNRKKNLDSENHGESDNESESESED